MKIIFFFLIIACLNNSQTLVGTCEGCEAVFEFGDKVLSPVDTLPGFNDGTKVKLTGTIYKKDKTPAAGVILYIYHTNDAGIYEKKGNETGWGRMHGYMRGWIKTDSTGRYTFYTIKPGSYPNSTIPAHIHAILLEPDKRYYWIDDWNFADDPFLNVEEITSPRGGFGVVELKKEGNILTAKRDIFLGKNIPGY